VALSGVTSCSGQQHDYYCDTRVIGYYPDWHVSKLPVSQIRFDKFTHLIYFSIYPNADGSINTSEITPSNQAAFVQGCHSGEVKAIICAGGWGLSAGFSPMAGNAAARSAFVTNIVQYCLTNGFDGVDLDWEPVTSELDKVNYSLLIQELKTALSPHNLSLSIAVSAQGSEFNSAAIPYIDWVGVMAYDMGTPHSTYDDSIAALLHWQDRGVPVERLVLGVPFYGRKADGAYFAYEYIVANYHPLPSQDEVAGIYFNGIDTIQRKTAYVIQNSFGGISIWEIPEDTTDESSLLTAITNAIHLNRPPDLDCDGKINFVDYDFFARYYPASGCTNSNSWCDSTDLDASGNLDFVDIALFTTMWLH